MTFLPPPPEPGAGSSVGPYATSSPPLPPMRSLRGLWLTILVLFTLVGAADIVMAGAFLNRASLLDDVAEGSFVFDELLDADDAVTGALGAHVVLMVALAITFITWQFRHAKNAEALGERGGLGPPWAIGGWFVPVANYILPAVQLHQSSRMSDPRVAGQPGARGKGAPIVIVWAVLLALSALLFVSGGGLRPTDDEGNIQINGVDDVRSAASGDRTAALGMIGFVATSIAGGVMVFSLSTKQASAYERRLAAQPSVPPPGSSFTIPTYGAAPPPPPAPGQWDAPVPDPPAWAPPLPTAPAPPAPPAPPASAPPDPTTQWGTPPP